MSEPRRGLSPFFPLLLAVALVAGLFIGQDIASTSGGPLAVFQLRQPSASDKIGQVLDLIDQQYVDSVEKNALVDEVLQDILQRLDPHSYYISAAEIRAAQEPLEGSFDGIGVEFAIQHDTVVVISPATMAMPVFARASHATRAFLSCARMPSSTASEIWSQTLSGCPSVTDSEVN